MRDRRDIEAAYAAAARQTAFPGMAGWQPVSLANGDAGLALVCGYLDACFPDDGWDRTGHGYLTLAADAAERQPHLPPGLFGGTAGLGMAAWSLSRGGTRYQRLLASVDDALLAQVTEQAGRVTGRRHGMFSGEFDAISGLAGVAAYLLCRRDTGAADAALDLALAALVALVTDAEVPARWWTPPDLMGNMAVAERYPHGYLNCGLAHGIPGPLAAISLALLCDVTVPGLPEAAERAADWIAGHRADDRWGVNWPAVVPLTAERAEAAQPGNAVQPGSADEPSRSAWCYGTPGVARALWLAGLALGLPVWRDLAVEAMRAVYRRPVAVRLIDSPTFCHGVAGLLQVTLRFANDTGLPDIADAAVAVTEQLLALHEPESLAGYRIIEPGGGRVDSPGLLDGAPGVVLTLLAAATDVEPGWDRAFLLA